MLADDRMEEMSERHGALILQEDSEVLVSLVSLWEVEIKSRITSGGGVADGLGHRLKAGDGELVWPETQAQKREA